MERNKEQKIKKILACITFFLCATLFIIIYKDCKGNKEPEDVAISNVKKYLYKNLHDPSSYTPVGWSKIIKNEDNCFIRHVYRAKNGFGAIVKEERDFLLNCETWEVEGMK